MKRLYRDWPSRQPRFAPEDEDLLEKSGLMLVEIAGPRTNRGCPAKRLYLDGQSSQRRKTSDPFVPPNPNELESAT